MCLYVDKKLTEKAKSRKTGVTVIRYKVLEFINGNLVSPVKHWSFWETGIKKSNATNRSKLNVRQRTPNEVSRGIHVYVDREEACRSVAGLYVGNCVVAPVHCKNEYLIAIGYNFSTLQEVYTQVTLKKKPSCTN